MRSQPGFTLIEALIVLAILGLAGATAVLVMQTILPRLALDAAAERLAADLSQTRLRAMTQGVIAIYPEYDGSDRPIFPRMTARRLTGITLKIEKPVNFSADGWTAGGRLLLERNKEVRVVVVEAPMGLVRIEEAHAGGR